LKETNYKREEENVTSLTGRQVFLLLMCIPVFYAQWEILVYIYDATTWLDFTKGVFFDIVLATIVKAVIND